MVGRTPEYLGKKVEPFEMKMAVVVCLTTPVAILIGAGLMCLVPQVVDSLNNALPHGFSELLYAATSAGANNGSAFAGLNANTPFLNVLLSALMYTQGRTLGLLGEARVNVLEVNLALEGLLPNGHGVSGASDAAPR